MKDQKKLSELQTKDKLNHFLLLTGLTTKETKSGKKYLDLELRDKSTSLNSKMWSNFEEFLKTAQIGSVVKIEGVLDEFNNQPQIKIEKIRIVDEKEGITPTDFLPKSSRPIKEMELELANTINQIQNQYIKELLNRIFSEENFSRYKKVPAGKAWHHAYIGGLIEHTLEIIKICNLMADIHPEINRDLLVTGAILHDFGKTEELEFSSGFEYTTKGKLLGHIVIVANLIEKEASKIENFPEELKNLIIHLVLSHQGRLEYASPVTPKTLEAIVLYHADELSAKTNAYKGAIMNEKNNEWTKYLPLAETSLYVPKSLSNGDDFKDTLF